MVGNKNIGIDRNWEKIKIYIKIKISRMFIRLYLYYLYYKCVEKYNMILIL